MLKVIAPNIWHMQHGFVVNGLAVSSRMTVVRLQHGGLWLHSPVPLSDEVRAELAALGSVEFIVAPNKVHHLFVAACLDAFPQAKLYGAPGLTRKRPDLQGKGMLKLTTAADAGWQADLDQLFFEGIPFANETVWFHKPTRTLIVTDLCQWWQGDMPFAARAYAHFTGVRKRLDVPRTVRWVTKDRVAARASAQKILQWPIERVVMAHNAIVEESAHAQVKAAFSWF